MSSTTMDDEKITELRRIATEFRGAIERSRAEKATPHLPYFPDGACKMASWLFAMHLSARGDYAVRFVTGHVPGFDSYVRHAWLVVDDAVVDLTADPFGQPAVVVGEPTPFHESLGEREECDAATAITAFSEQETARYRRLLGPIEERIGRSSSLPSQ